MLELIIPMPALSINHSHTNAKPTWKNKGPYKVLRNGGRIKKQETRHYEAEFQDHLLKYSDEITEFLRDFNDAIYCVHAQYLFFFPQDKYFKQGMKISMKCGDTDNMIKICQDLVFGNLMNDGHAIHLSVSRYPSDSDAFICVRLDYADIPQERYSPETVHRIGFPTMLF